MPGDFTERRVDGPLEMRIVRLEERTTAAADALKIAAGAIDKRLELMNELRDQINKERGSYVTRTEVEGIQKTVNMLCGGLLTIQVLIGVILYFVKH